MPITKQAEKKLRHDQKITHQNNLRLTQIKKQVKATRKTPSQSTLQTAFKLLDKAVKTHLIHKNRAARLKSRLTKLLKK